jgi:hypothetical protein
MNPIILFTNQRTGSSSFTRWLDTNYRKEIDLDFINRSVLESVSELGYTLPNLPYSHERFDHQVGEFYCIIEQYEKDNNMELLVSAIKAILSHKIHIKIMVEFTPLWFIKILLSYIEDYNYKTFFLYREDGRARIASQIIMDLDLIRTISTYPSVNTILTDVNKKNSDFINAVNMHCISYENLYLRKDPITNNLISKITGLADIAPLRDIKVLTLND